MVVVLLFGRYILVGTLLRWYWLVGTSERRENKGGGWFIEIANQLSSCNHRFTRRRITPFVVNFLLRGLKVWKGDLFRSTGCKDCAVDYHFHVLRFGKVKREPNRLSRVTQLGSKRERIVTLATIEWTSIQ